MFDQHYSYSRCILNVLSSVLDLLSSQEINVNTARLNTRYEYFSLCFLFSGKLIETNCSHIGLFSYRVGTNGVVPLFVTFSYRVTTGYAGGKLKH